MYKIDPDGLGEIEVYCDQKTAGGGWTVFQKRHDGSVDFVRVWDGYKRGFGNLTREFWLGLDKIHRLAVGSINKLRVDLEDVRGKQRGICRVQLFCCGKRDRETPTEFGELFRYGCYC